MALAATCLIASGAWLVATPAAQAASVACGATITKSVTLTADLLNCAGGLTIGANGVVLNMNGHTMSGGGGIGMYDYSDVTVENGILEGSAIEGGGNAADGGATHNQVVKHMTVRGSSGFDCVGFTSIQPYTTADAVINSTLTGCSLGVDAFLATAMKVVGNTIKVVAGANSQLYGIDVYNEDGYEGTGAFTISHNTVTGPVSTSCQVGPGVGGMFGAIPSDVGIWDYGNTGDVITSNSVTGFEYGIAADQTSSTSLGYNKVAKAPCGIYIDYSGNNYQSGPVTAQWNVVNGGRYGIYDCCGATVDTLRQNTVKKSHFGIYIDGMKAVLANNRTESNAVDGIYVNPLASGQITANTSDYNGHDGINVASATSLLTSNVADYNTYYGIEAQPGEDGGGNVAVGNGAGQCANLAC